jgi:hypothetical protein
VEQYGTCIIFKYIQIIILGYSCEKSRGFNSRNRFILYRGFPFQIYSKNQRSILLNATHLETLLVKSVAQDQLLNLPVFALSCHEEKHLAPNSSRTALTTFR